VLLKLSLPWRLGHFFSLAEQQFGFLVRTRFRPDWPCRLDQASEFFGGQLITRQKLLF
jgi:hypothetical protein